MMGESERRAAAAGFSVYDHEWRYLASHLGEPSLHDGLLVFDDGTVLSVCAFPLGGRPTVTGDQLMRLLESRVRPDRHRLVHAWGNFEVPESLAFDERFTLADPSSRSDVYEGEYTIDLSDLSYAETPALRKIRRQIQHGGISVEIVPSEPLSGRQLRLIEIWRNTHHLSPLGISAGHAIASFVRERCSYTANAYVDGEIVGFSVFTHPTERAAVNLMSFSERRPGLRVDDALTWESISFNAARGCEAFHLGYAGSDSLRSFKRKWGALRTGPSYRDAMYVIDGEWRQKAISYAFSWGCRLFDTNPTPAPPEPSA